MDDKLVSKNEEIKLSKPNLEEAKAVHMQNDDFYNPYLDTEQNEDRTKQVVVK